MDNQLLRLAALAARYLPDRAKNALYRYPPLARLIREQLNRAVTAGPVAVDIAGGALAGMRMVLDLRSEKDYWLGTYEPELVEAIQDLVKPGMVAYDVGANMGYITLLLARKVTRTGRVVAFEPFPDNFERLRMNVELNNLEKHVSLVRAAVAGASADIDFLVGPSGGMGKAAGSAGRQNVAYPGTISVPGISLDDFVYGQRNPLPQIIKLDIEGGETLALPGMRRLLEDGKPVLLLELHGGEAAQIVWQELSAAGYRISRLSRNYPAVKSVVGLDWKAYLAAFPGG